MTTPVPVDGDTPEGPARRRDLRPLGRLGPFIAAHRLDAFLAGLFLLVSSSATVGLTFAVRLMADKGLSSHSAAMIDRAFLTLALVAVVLAVSTGGRFYFITKLGERVVADLRAALYGHVMTLDQGYFLKVRTGEVLSRMTTDLAIVESMVGSTISVALRNALTVIASLSVLIIVNPALTGFVVMDFEAEYDTALADLRDWVESGQLKVFEDVVDGFENLPAALVGLLAGENVGKRMVKVI